MPLITYYNTGTATVATGDTVVTFATAGLGSSEFPTIMPGDLFCDPAQPEFPPQRIASVDYDSDPQTVDLWEPWPGAGMTAAPYEIRLVGDISRSTAQTRRYLEMLGTLAFLGIQPDAFGEYADRSAYDDQSSGFLYLSLNGDNGVTTSSWTLYVKNTSDTGDWSSGQQIEGPTGPSGVIGNWRGPWLTATAYAVNDAIQINGASYICVTAHTSGTFATDLAAGKWQLSADKGSNGIFSATELIKTAAYTALVGDVGKTIILNKATSDTLSFSAAATLGSTWMVIVKNIGAGTWTLDPNGSELIDGATTGLIKNGQSMAVSSNGTALRSFFLSNAGRELLTAARTYYVRTDGNDANDGLANTSGGAFLTIQKAIDVAAALDTSIYDVTIQVGAGTYALGLGLKAKQGVGAGKIILVGDETTPANVTLASSGAMAIATEAAFFSKGLSTTYSVRGFNFTSTGTGSPSAIIATSGSYVEFQNCNFGSGHASQIRADDSGIVFASGNYSISSGGGAHIATVSGTFRIQNRTVTLTGTPAFSTAFADANRNGVILLNGNTYTGSATGKRYSSLESAVINAGGVTLPGDATGTAGSGAVYDGVVYPGPTTTVDNTIARYDGTQGVLQGTGVVIDDSNQVGLGTASPAAKLDISNNAGAIPAPVSNTAVRLASADGATPLFLIDGYASEGQFAFRRGNTSAATPSAILSGETIGGLTAYGHDGTGYISNSRAKFAMQAAQNWASGAHGTQFTWETTANGGTSRTAKMVLHNDGSLVMGAPTGGNKGLGTINATAVYDDNVLLTCMALRARFLELGLVDTDYWDNLVPDLIVPERREQLPAIYTRSESLLMPVIEEVDGRLVRRFVEQQVESEAQVVWADPLYDEIGDLIGAVETPLFDEVVTPEQVIPRRHELAHRFKAMIDDGFDPRNPIAYFAKLKADEALPGMPTKDDWEQGGISTGEMTGRLWLAMEMLAVVTMDLHERVTALEAN